MADRAFDSRTGWSSPHFSYPSYCGRRSTSRIENVKKINKMTIGTPLLIASAKVLALACTAYALVLAAGLLTLPSADLPIQDPWFSLMELLILIIAPTMVVYAVGLHAIAAPARRPIALAGVVFMSLCAVISCSVHFAVLTVSRHPAFIDLALTPLLFSFAWPSLVYALDILAWDFFFALGALFAGLSVEGAGRRRLPRALLIASAALAFVGLAGVPLSNMQVRNIGIVGYALLFPAGAWLMARALRSAD